ncbi:hypothetical protein [Corynebacterium tapiri]
MRGSILRSVRASARARRRPSERDAQVSQGRVDVGDQRLKAGEGQRETDQARHDEHRTEQVTACARQALAQGVEHADGGVEDHAVDHEGHDHAHPRVNLIDEGEHRHVGAVDSLDLKEERGDQQHEHDQVEDSAQQAAVAGSLGVHEAAADHDGHGHGSHDVKPGVVQGGDPPVGQGGFHAARGLIESCQVPVGGHQGVHGDKDDEDDHKGGHGADDGSDLFHVHHAGNQHQHQHDHSANPQG